MRQDLTSHEYIEKERCTILDVSEPKPELELTALMFESPETIKKAQKEYADKYLIKEYEFYTSEPHNVYDKARPWRTCNMAGTLAI